MRVDLNVFPHSYLDGMPLSGQVYTPSWCHRNDGPPFL